MFKTVVTVAISFGGGKGSDTFVFRNISLDPDMNGNDIVRDYEVGADQLDVSIFELADFTELTLVDGLVAAVVYLDEFRIGRVDGVAAADPSADDFLL